MRTIATLGPIGTFSDIATQSYLKELPQSNIDVKHYPSIKSVLKSIGRDCDFGVVPIENFSEGFIPVILDELVASPLTVCAELVLPIHFACVSHSNSYQEIKRLFVQFVAKGQCSEFIATLSGVEIVLTESNIESLQLCTEAGDAAIVPSHAVDTEFALHLQCVNDYQDNQTRFLVLAKDVQADWFVGEGGEKTSIIVLEGNDYPGLLGDVLAEFSSRKINLSSIISRPTKKEFGKYHFFIDFDGGVSSHEVSEALTKINHMNQVKILGSYRKLTLEPTLK